MLGVGIGLRVIAYTRRSILWLDEAATARNIIERSLHDLLTVPLDYGQAAPKGFLLIEWLVTRVLGTSELAFRFVPFVTGVASLVAFRAVARRLLSPIGALAALFFLAVGYWFIVYSAETHPYGLDLLLSMAALYIAIELRRLEYPRRQVWGAAAFGAAAAWLSNGTVIALFGLAVALGIIAWREHGWSVAVRRLWPIAISWGVSAAVAVWVNVHGMFPSTRDFFAWSWRNGMVPVLRSRAAARWLWEAWRVQLSSWHGFAVDDPVWTSLYVSLALIGCVSLLVRRTRDAIFAGSIVAAFVLVSMAKQYPYDARFLLPSIAVFILGVGESIGLLATAEWGRGRIVGQALAALLCVPPLVRLVKFPPPYHWTVTGAYLAEIRGRWQPGDIVYSTHTQALELLQSAPRFGFTRNDYLLGPCNFSDLREPLRAADALRGRRRVWLLVGPGLYFPMAPEYAYLRTIGVRRDSLAVDLPGSVRAGEASPFDIGTAYLFDLSDPSRLARATADTYVFSPLVRATTRSVSPWNCFGVWSLHRESVAERTGTTGNRD